MQKPGTQEHKKGLANIYHPNANAKTPAERDKEGTFWDYLEGSVRSER